MPTSKTAKGSGKWKDKLLSCSVPLEFESANFFRSEGFAIGPEFNYSRISESGTAKEFSVDFLATHYPIFDDDNDLRATLEVPVECKYRTRNKRWLFLPEPEEEYSSIAHGIRVIDEFSAFTMEREATRKLNVRTPVAYKGIEINLETGDVHDADLKHGINQLKYALPSLIAEHIIDSIHYTPEDNQPLILFPLLVTTATLWILNPQTTIEDCKAADSLEDLSCEVSHVALRTGSGRDFGKHIADAFVEFKEIEAQDVFHVLTRRSEDCKKRSGYYDPIAKAHSLAEGEADSSWFGSYVICNSTGLPALVKDLKSALDADVANIELTFPRLVP